MFQPMYHRFVFKHNEPVTTYFCNIGLIKPGLAPMCLSKCMNLIIKNLIYELERSRLTIILSVSGVEKKVILDHEWKHTFQVL